MNKRGYTHDFPAGASDPATGAGLATLTYVFYAHAWARQLTNWIYPEVLSPYWRLLHCPRGAATVLFDRLSIPLTRTNLVLIPAEVRTALHSHGRIDMLYSHFLPWLPDGEPLGQAFTAPLDLTLNHAQRGLIRQLIRSPSDPPHPGDVLIHRALLDVCFARVLPPLLLRRPPRTHPADTRVAHLLALLRTRSAEPWSNARLAAAVALSPAQTVRLFTRAVGRSPHDYLRRQRLNDAARHLATSNASIKEIAAACGFANRFHFTRCFSAHLGLGPAAFRRRVRLATPPR